MTTRRNFLRAVTALGLSGLMVPEAFAFVPTERRFVFIILRGGMDSLSAIAPTGDPHYANMRDLLALEPDDITDMLRLDPVFSLHPALGPLKRIYAAKQLAVVHAAATEYRGRSHFDAQDTVEAGGMIARRRGTGWVYRALQSKFGDVRLGISLGPNVPLAIEGEPPASNYAPSRLKNASDDFIDAVTRLWSADPELGPTMSVGLKTKEMTERTLAEGEVTKGISADAFAGMAAVAGRLLAQPTGPRVAVLDMNGFDTHRMQGVLVGPLARSLSRLSMGIEALEKGLGDVWSKTAVVVVSEFGRTVRPNGTKGTDHGTAGASILAGGAINGGRVIADWPGLDEAKLFEARDLKPTIDLRSVLKGVLQDHLGMERRKLDEEVFPGSSAVAPMPDLIRA